MEFSKNYGQIIIGYGLLSIGITLVMLFMQTSGIFWLILSGITIVGGIWIIKKERIYFLWYIVLQIPTNDSITVDFQIF